MAELEKMRAEFGSKTAELKDRNETLLQPIS